MTRTFAVAIDGPVAAGKTTIGRRVADELSALFFDSGIMYRAIAVQVLKDALDPEDECAVAELAESIDIELKSGQSQTHLFVNGNDVTDLLRSPEVDRALPPIAANPRVREALLGHQRSAIQGRKSVVVGRDIGTVILPGAQLKVYLDADADVRAIRRFKELQDRGVDITWDTVYQDLLARDERDIGRDQSPLRVAEGAVVIDASDKSVDEIVREILALIHERNPACIFE